MYILIQREQALPADNRSYYIVTNGIETSYLLAVN
jgi:hypothetical protein